MKLLSVKQLTRVQNLISKGQGILSELKPTTRKKGKDWLGRELRTGSDWLGREQETGPDWLGRRQD